MRQWLSYHGADGLEKGLDCFQNGDCDGTDAAEDHNTADHPLGPFLHLVGARVWFIWMVQQV